MVTLAVEVIGARLGTDMRPVEVFLVTAAATARAKYNPRWVARRVGACPSLECCSKSVLPKTVLNMDLCVYHFPARGCPV
jgi:hypothetical protein